VVSEKRDDDDEARPDARLPATSCVSDTPKKDAPRRGNQHRAGPRGGPFLSTTNKPKGRWVFLLSAWYRPKVDSPPMFASSPPKCLISSCQEGDARRGTSTAGRENRPVSYPPRKGSPRSPSILIFSPLDLTMKNGGFRRTSKGETLLCNGQHCLPTLDGRELTMELREKDRPGRAVGTKVRQEGKALPESFSGTEVGEISKNGSPPNSGISPKSCLPYM